MKDFEILPHTADIKIRVYGSSLAEFFRNAVVGMFQAIGPIAPACRREQNRLVCPSLPQKHAIVLTAPEITALLVDFLSEALYLSDVYDEAYLDATIDEISPTSIKATLHGIKIKGFEVVEIKAVTYHDLSIQQKNGRWQADIVFDI